MIRESWRHDIATFSLLQKYIYISLENCFLPEQWHSTNFVAAEIASKHVCNHDLEFTTTSTIHGYHSRLKMEKKLFKNKYPHHFPKYFHNRAGDAI